MRTKRSTHFFVSTSFLIKAIFLFLFVSLLIRVFYYSLTDGFSIARIENTIPFHEKLISSSPSEEIKNTILLISKEPFVYFKKGSQAYAFISSDGRWILKLFKCHHLQQADWAKDLPFSGKLANWRDDLVKRRSYRISLALGSYSIVQDCLKDECAILYSQVLPSSSYSLPITLKDKTGRTYSIDLAHYGFAIQRKAELVVPSIENWLKAEKIDDAKAALDSLVAIVVKRSKKGIQDSDPDPHKNAGLIGTTAVFIDIGSFHKNPHIAQPEEMKRDMKKMFQRLLDWLDKTSPTLKEHLEMRLENFEDLSWNPPSTSF